ncbi:MAG TPA: UbiA-like polyprenyltransferase [Phycisphaerae bacterium]|nr:UbiA-like polyprenyltransferase [Phycisphaerae bacterium]HNU45748.1 UbiA-like polyprenyltransferase [Phycisphaerae bacterium]
MSGWTASVRLWGETVKFSHSVFALPFALLATFLAGRTLPGRSLPHAGQLGLIALCMVAARSVAMTYNRIVDAQLDARNPRTADRPIPSGRLSAVAAWSMLAVFVVTFGIGCAGFYLFYGNTWPLLLAGPVLLYLGGYSFTKRFTKWSHFYLGSAIAMSPVAAWLAIHPGTLGWPAVLLMLAVTCWIAGFDIIYACQDIEVDRRDGLYSLPARLGPRRALGIARVSHAVSLSALAALAPAADLGWVYGIGVVLAAVLLVVENSLVRPGDYRHVNVAFFTCNGLVSLALALAGILDVAVW